LTAKWGVVVVELVTVQTYPIKIMNNLTHYITALTLVTAVSSASANWLLVEDFESGMDNIYSLRFAEPEPIIGIFEDPADASNQMFYLDTNAYGVADWAPSYIAITLPQEIAPTAQATLYFRFYHTGPGHDMAGGLSDVAIVPNPDAPYPNGMLEPGGWAALESQFQMHAPGSDLFRVRDGSGFEATQIAIPNNEWVEIWLLVDMPANTTRYYVKRASDAEPVLGVFTDAFGSEKTEAAFRNGTSDPLVSFFMGTVAGLAENPLPGDPFFIDDIYIDATAHNLTTPSGGGSEMTWAGYPMGADGWVSTGGWLGMVNVLEDWVYVNSLNGWSYLPESHVSEAGAWMYIVKP
jgi:hypothetical protein